MGAGGTWNLIQPCYEIEEKYTTMKENFVLKTLNFTNNPFENYDSM